MSKGREMVMSAAWEEERCEDVESLKSHVKEFESGLETRDGHGNETAWRALALAVCADSSYGGFSKLSIKISVPHWVGKESKILGNSKLAHTISSFY